MTIQALENVAHIHVSDFIMVRLRVDFDDVFDVCNEITHQRISVDPGLFARSRIERAKKKLLSNMELISGPELARLVAMAKNRREILANEKVLTLPAEELNISLEDKAILICNSLNSQASNFRHDFETTGDIRSRGLSVLLTRSQETIMALLKEKEKQNGEV